jgi:amidase
VHDAFLMPVDFVTAFPHDHSPETMARKIVTPGGPRPYLDMLKWIFHATLTGNPATACPVARRAALRDPDSEPISGGRHSDCSAAA